MNCLIDLSQLTNYRLQVSDGITAILRKVEVRALNLGSAPVLQGPILLRAVWPGRTRPEIKQVHRLSESPEQIAAVDREVAARAAP